MTNARIVMVGAYRVTDDPSTLDMDLVHAALSERSYWARGRARATTEGAFANSRVAVALDADDRTVGFARAVTDDATFAWLADVWVERDHRGHGLGLALSRHLVDAPDLCGIRRWCLVTSSAQELYRRLGFTEIAAGGDTVWMERRAPTI